MIEIVRDMEIIADLGYKLLFKLDAGGYSGGFYRRTLSGKYELDTQ